jgi:hypothetical protein
MAVEIFSKKRRKKDGGPKQYASNKGRFMRQLLGDELVSNAVDSLKVDWIGRV